MHIAAVGWIYVTLMMAITEETVIAGIMTFFFYGVLPTLIILYVSGSGQRRRRREQETQERLAAMQARQADPPEVQSAPNVADVASVPDSGHAPDGAPPGAPPPPVTTAAQVSGRMHPDQ